MVTGGIPEEDGQKNTKGTSRSWGTTLSGQSVSTSGSLGSPSSRSEVGMATPASESTCLRLSNLEIQGDDAKSPGAAANKKKKRGQRAAGGDKSNRGLRQFSMKVCEKVESKGTTTYNEVADELVTEFADPINSGAPPDQLQYDEKNIRRRVYDALNVLMAMDIISKDKKEIHWKGLPRSSPNDVEELKAQQLALRNRIEKRAAYLRELQEQFIGYQNLIRRNHQLYDSGNAPSGGVALPFILVQTRPNATVEVEISEDMQLVHFDFNSTPFELHDDNYVLKQMNFCGSSSGSAQDLLANGGESSSMSNVNHTHIPLANGGESSSMSNVDCTQVQLANGGESSSMANANCTPIPLANGGESSSLSNVNCIHIPQAWQSGALVRTPTSSTPPGIIKTRVKNEP